MHCTPHFLDEAPDQKYQLCNNIMEPMPMSKVRLKGSFHYLSGGWIYSQPRDQTCSVYGWHACNAAGFNPTGVERSCHAQGAWLQMKDMEHTGRSNTGRHYNCGCYYYNCIYNVIPLLNAYMTWTTYVPKVEEVHCVWIIHPYKICTTDYGVLSGYELEEFCLRQFTSANQIIKKKNSCF